VRVEVRPRDLRQLAPARARLEQRPPQRGLRHALRPPAGRVLRAPPVDVDRAFRLRARRALRIVGLGRGEEALDLLVRQRPAHAPLVALARGQRLQRPHRVLGDQLRRHGPAEHRPQRARVDVHRAVRDALGEPLALVAHQVHHAQVTHALRGERGEHARERVGDRPQLLASNSRSEVLEVRHAQLVERHGLPLDGAESRELEIALANDLGLPPLGDAAIGRERLAVPLALGVGPREHPARRALAPALHGERAAAECSTESSAAADRLSAPVPCSSHALRACRASCSSHGSAPHRGAQPLVGHRQVHRRRRDRGVPHRGLHQEQVARAAQEPRRKGVAQAVRRALAEPGAIEPQGDAALRVALGEALALRAAEERVRATGSA
jgi:hypothetical protein